MSSMLEDDCSMGSPSSQVQRRFENRNMDGVQLFNIILENIAALDLPFAQ